MPPQDNNAAVAAQPSPPRKKRRWLRALSVVSLLVLGAIGGAVLFPPQQLPAPAPPQAGPSQAVPMPQPAPPQTERPQSERPQIERPQIERPSPFDIPTADEAAILAFHPATLQVFRDQSAPHVLVLSFPSLHEQGRTFDRIGAFVEKAGLPRDRVLDETDLQAAIRISGETEDTFYYGHDYRAADLARFFAVADRDGIALHPEEETLRRLLTQEGMLVPGAVGAVISVPPVSVMPPVDATARATILHHELSHGAYFTDPAYTAYSRNFWQNVLTEAQRTGFRRFLAKEGYDATNEDLMLNEAQAYLVHTPDPRYFRPELAGLSDAEAARLRGIFLAGMPDGWLQATPPLHSP